MPPIRTKPADQSETPTEPEEAPVKVDDTPITYETVTTHTLELQKTTITHDGVSSDYFRVVLDGDSENELVIPSGPSPAGAMSEAAVVLASSYSQPQ